LLLEILALRQQLAVLNAKRLAPKLRSSDKAFWLVLRQLWPLWKRALVLVQPETVVRWHTSLFAFHWSWISRKRKRLGRKPTNNDLRNLIFRMVEENRTWGAPRIHGELRMLGFDISERTVQRWMRKAPRTPQSAKQWQAFLINHREAIAAMDFFTVPTLTFGLLHCFFVISHDRRILHLNVTKYPSGMWVAQQLREAFPYDSAPKYLIFDRAKNFGDDTLSTIRGLGIVPKRISFRSPWQNGIAERFVGNCRRDLPDYVIVLNERHLKRLMTEYVRYYHEDRTHLGLEKQAPVSRTPASDPNPGCRCQVISMTRLGGLHHRHDLAA
jgi:transposase InsO family protein